MQQKKFMYYIYLVIAHTIIHTLLMYNQFLQSHSKHSQTAYILKNYRVAIKR